MTSALRERLADRLEPRLLPPVTHLAGALARETGAAAVLFYGSNLRTGSREGVLDFYVLLPDGRENRIWPRVSYREVERGGKVLRAKIATMRLATLERAATGDLLDTTIWTRFVQPSALAWHRTLADRERVTAAIESATITAARLAAALGPEEGREEVYWRALFAATYRAELRVERAGREAEIVRVNEAHFTGLLPAALKAAGIGCEWEGDRLRPHLAPHERKRTLRWWRRRQRLGRALNLARLIRATRSFEGAARYGAWKLERHTGIALVLSPWQERHPLLAAPAVLWRVWRQRNRRG